MRAYEFLTHLFEASYDTMIAAMKRKYSNSIIQSDIDWAKQYLKRQDRVVWYLRILDQFLSGSEPDSVNGYSILGNKYNFHAFKESLWHYIGQDIPKIQSYVFNRQPAEQVFNDFENIEREYIAKQGKNIGVKPQSGDYKLLSFKDGSNWWYIDRAYCPEEGRSGSHCGNVVGKTVTNQRILSYRDKDNRVILTFILEPDGSLGEMKAKGNLKPDEKYHSMIMQLLLNPMIKGIKGLGFLPDMNFSVFDLDDEYIKILQDRKPKLLSDQLSITPYEILKSPEWIKNDPNYSKIAISKVPQLADLLSDNSIDNWKKAISANPKLIIYAPDDYPNYVDKLFKYLVKNETPVDHMFEVRKKYRTNTEFLKKLVKEKAYMLAVIPPTQKNYHEICEVALKNSGWALMHVAKEYRDYDLCMIAVKSTGTALQYLPDNLTDIQLNELYKAGLKSDGTSLEHIPVNKRTRELCDIAVKQNGMALRNVPHNLRDDDMYADAVKSQGMALQLVPEEKRTEQLCRIAVRFLGTPLEHVPVHLRTYDMCVRALRAFWPDSDTSGVVFDKVLRHVPPNVIKQLKDNYGEVSYENLRNNIKVSYT